MCLFCNQAGLESGGLGCRDLPAPTDPGTADATNASDGSTGAAPVFSVAQIVQQLRTQWGGSFEGTTESWGGTGAINYYIGGVPFSSAEEGAYKINMTSLMLSRATLAFELWDDLIARDLNQVFTATFGQIQFEYASRTYNSNNVLGTDGGTYSRSWFTNSGSSPNGYGTASYNTTRDEIWLNSNWSSHNADNDMFFGGYGFQTYMHEIGHSLGLSHPGTYNAGNGGSITFANSAEYSQDNRQYTIMSYFGGYNSNPQQGAVGWQQDGTFLSYLYSSTPMLHDVAAIQAIYGADTTTRTGNTTYGFNVSNGVPDVFNFAIDTSPIVTVWDAGGIDTLDLSGYSASQRIDLHAGTYSDVGGMLSNFAIAYNVTIESAIGGSGNDTIVGNDADNTLRGRGGNDSIDGGGGNDSAVFSGARAAYTLTALGGTGVRVAGPDGTDTLTNVEWLVFDDQTVSWPLPAPPPPPPPPPASGPPDLDAINLGLSSAVTTGSVTVSYTVANNGGTTAGASTVGIFLSNDATYDGSDTLLTTRSAPSLNGGASFNDSFGLTLSTMGSYFVIAVADYGNAVLNESDEGNNASNAVQITVVAPAKVTGGSGPDTLRGGSGKDKLVGGSGPDTFVFDAIALQDALSATPVFDRIADYDQGNNPRFDAAEGDQINLAAILGTAFAGGQSANALVRAIRDGIDGSSLLQVDIDGSANGARWTTIARLDGVAAGETLKVVLSDSLPAGTTVVVQDVNATTTVGNYDGDTHGDLLWRNTDGTVGIWLMNGPNIVAPRNVAMISDDWHVAGIGDFGGDSKGDILWRNDDGRVGMWQLSGNAVAAAGDIMKVSSDWHVAGTGDFGGDGKSDILWRNDSGLVGIWQMNGTAILSAANILQIDNNWHVAGTGDFNGDGKSDILWRNDNGTIGIWHMNGSAILSAENIPQIDQAWHIAGTGDFNGDGRSDILWRNDSGLVGMWQMNGSAVQSASNILSVPLDWHIIGTGDFGGDGKADILWNGDDGTIGLWTMNGAAIQSAQNIHTAPHDWTTVAHHWDLV